MTLSFLSVSQIRETKGSYHLKGNRKFRLENQMVRAIPVWKVSENMNCDLWRCNVSTRFSLFS